jgi:hypothetical protein
MKTLITETRSELSYQERSEQLMHNGHLAERISIIALQAAPRHFENAFGLGLMRRSPKRPD